MQTLALVTAALAPTEEILRNEYNRQLTAQCAKVIAELTEDGMDANKRYFYPSGSMGRVAYHQQVARFNLCKQYTTGAGCRSMCDPDIRIVKADNTERIAKKAAEMAKAALEGYCGKLTGKLLDACKGSIVSVTYQGGTNPWAWSYITVDFINCGKPNGKQVWETKMIVNVSCLGKVFNQWPTRLQK